MAKSVFPDKMDICIWETLRRKGNSTVAKSCGQIGEGPCTQKVDGGMRNANLIGRSGSGGSGRSSIDIPHTKGKE
jgi:hypothetical protein